MVPGGLRKPLLKNIPQKTSWKSAKQTEIFDFGVPQKQGSNEECTNFSSLFRLRASLGQLWGTPGSQNGPKTSSKSLRDPSGRQCYTIVVLFLLFFLLVFVVLWVWFRQDIHTKNAVGTVAEMARSATGYISSQKDTEALN